MIRNAKESDAQQIALVHVATWRAAYLGLISDDILAALSVADGEKQWRSIISDEHSRVIVSVINNQIVGFSNFGPTRDTDIGTKAFAEILAIYVQPDFWNKGVGRDLMHATLQQLCSDGFKEATLWVLDTNTRARGFYVKAGFSEDGGSKIDRHCVNAELHEVRYRLSL